MEIIPHVQLLSGGFVNFYLIVEPDGPRGSELGRWLADEEHEFILGHPDHATAVEEHRHVLAAERARFYVAWAHQPRSQPRRLAG